MATPDAQRFSPVSQQPVLAARTHEPVSTAQLRTRLLLCNQHRTGELREACMTSVAVDAGRSSIGQEIASYFYDADPRALSFRGVHRRTQTGCEQAQGR